MRRRNVSPARSEAELDISASLFSNNAKANGWETESENEASFSKSSKNQNAPFDLDVMGEESGLDDETIIAGQQAASNRKATFLKGRTVKKGGGFQALGLNANLLKAITRKGFSVPTPIQRKTIPLLLNDKDVVGMARTGSGKTAAFIIPLIEKLKAHSSKVGARALVLSPSRELALQTLQVVKDLGRGTDLRSVLLVGGDSLEEQFSSMINNPDIIIATPGRFLHLKVEMTLDLSSMRYVVFDEADRLFEMGFAAQLTEILHALPASRQTLLFSATLPKSLVEFARAGLQDPTLVRLDADSKISPDLQSAFFTVKSSEKEGALLHILQDIIHMPTKSQIGLEQTSEETVNPKKRKRTEIQTKSRSTSNAFSTIVFAATKHHVEYLANLLRCAGYAVSHVYGALDQTARKMQVSSFRAGQTNILVVTDVAARGIDIPVLANVINYDFPSQAKIFVHRVGRTARAGQKGWSYSIIHDSDAPYLLDLQLFLGRKLRVGRASDVSFAEEVVVGSLQRDEMQTSCEWVSKTLDNDADIAALRSVAMKGEKLYQRTRNAAAAESAKRARSLVASDSWIELHPLFNDASNSMEVEREKMLAKVGGFRPQESIFEIGARRGGRKGNEEAIDVMRKIRSGLEGKKWRSLNRAEAKVIAVEADEELKDDDVELELGQQDNMSMASDSELEVTFSHPQPNGKQRKPQISNDGDIADLFRSPDNFMAYTPTATNLTEDRGYGVHSGANTNSNANFAEAARGVTMDLGLDESGGRGFGEARGIMRWDKRQKKYVARRNDEDGSKGTRLVRGESGAKIAASFRSGRFDKWRKDNRVDRVARVGETEKSGSSGGAGGKRYRHKQVKMPKPADKFREDYEVRKKKVAGAKERAIVTGGGVVQGSGAARGRPGKKGELNSVDDIRKQRKLKEKRREKNARPSKKGIRR